MAGRGDPELPATMRQGTKDVPWPAEAGALRVKMRFNPESDRSRQAYQDVKFFGPSQGWSIGYAVPPGTAR